MTASAEKLPLVARIMVDFFRDFLENPLPCRKGLKVLDERG